MDERYRLCYVSEPWVYFTTQELNKQWGDDWNDCAYEHNAEPPYTWDDKIWRDGEWIPNPEPSWDVKRVALAGDFETPCTYAYNSSYSVEMINAGAVPWLSTDRFVRSAPHTHIYAGTSYPEFRRLAAQAGWTVYEPVGGEP